MQVQLDGFKNYITHQLGNNQTQDITEVKLEVDKIKNIVSDLYDRLVIPELMVIEIMPEVHVKNKIKHQSDDKEVMNKAKKHSL